MNFMKVHLILKNEVIKIPSGIFDWEETVPLKDNYEYNLDRILDNFIKSRLYEKVITSLTLPISLTDNPFDFTGLILGHHIRLDSNKDIASVPQ